MPRSQILHGRRNRLTLWHADVPTWPRSTALANEAVHAAKSQSLSAASKDTALRLAFFRDSRCISLLHEVIDGCRNVLTSRRRRTACRTRRRKARAR